MEENEQTIIEQDEEELEDGDEVQGRLRRLVRDTLEYYENYVFPEAYEIVKAKVLFAGDLRALLVTTGNEHRSCSYYPLIAGIHDTFHSNTYGIIPEVRAVAQNPEDQEKTQTAQDFIDWAWSIGNAQITNEEMYSEATLLGLSSGQVSFSKNDKKVTYRVMDGDQEKDESVEFNDARPSLDHVPFFEMFIDPASNDIYNPRFKFRRKIKSWGGIKSSYSSFIPGLEEREDEILESHSYMSQYDYNKIWEIKGSTSVYVSEVVKQLSGDVSAISPETIAYQNIFKIDYENELVEIIEYRSCDELKILMNGILVYDGPTIYPINGDPFVHVWLEKLPGSTRCRGIGHKLMSHQKQINTHWNAVQDAVAMHLRPMYIVEKGAIKGHDGKEPQRITYKADQTFISSAIGVQNGGIRPIEFLDFNMITISRNLLMALMEEAREAVGVNSYTQGGQGKVERNPAAVRAKTQIINSRLQPLMSSMNRMQQKCFEFWIAMASLRKGEEFNARVLNKETGEAQYSLISPRDIVNRFDVIVENGEERLATKQERMSQIVQILQILTPYVTEQIAEGVMVNRIDFGDFIMQVLNSLDFKGLKVEDTEGMKEQIKEKVDLAMYHQSLIQNPEQAQSVAPSTAPVVPDRMAGESVDEYTDRSGVPDFSYDLETP